MSQKTYTITLADLVHIADAACELDGMRQFYVDRPDEQERIARMVAQLHDMAERAAREDAVRIYGPDDTCFDAGDMADGQAKAFRDGQRAGVAG